MPKRDASGRFVKGHSGNPRGRAVGVEAQITREVRELVRQALDAEGGAEYLRWAAREHPVAFLSLVGRLVPAEIRATLETLPLVVIRDYCGVNFEEIARLERVDAPPVIDVSESRTIDVEQIPEVPTSPPGPPQEPPTPPAEAGEAETLAVIPLAQQPIYGVAKRPPERF